MAGDDERIHDHPKTRRWKALTTAGRESGIWISADSLSSHRGNLLSLLHERVLSFLVGAPEAEETAQTESGGLVDTVNTTRPNPVAYDMLAALRPWKLYLERARAGEMI